MLKAKKALYVFIAFCMLLSLLSVSAFAALEFSDNETDGYWAAEALDNAVANGLLKGSDGKLMPKDNLTRAQMAAIINRAFGATAAADISAYTDVSKNAWYYSDMAKAVQMKTFQGDGTKLNPESDITRQEAFVVLARALNLSDSLEDTLAQFSDKSSIASWAVGSLAALAETGYIHGDGGKLRPTDTITREEFAQLMFNAFKTYFSTAGTYTEANSGNVMINASDVTLKGITIKGDLIIGDGVGSGDVHLNGVTVIGRVVVRGGGENSIHIVNNSNVGSIIISKTDSGSLRVVTEDGSQVEMIIVDDGVDDIILEGSFNGVTINSNTPLVLKNTAVDVLTVAAESADITINSGTVATVEITADAANTSLEVAKGAAVTTLNSSAGNVSISGSGTVDTAVVSGNNTAVNTAGTSLTVSDGTQGVTENGNTVSGGTETTTTTTTTTTGGTGGGGGGGSGSKSYTAKVSTVDELTAALGNKSVKSITITANIEISSEIAAAKPITIVNGVTVNIAGNGTLVVESTLVNNGTITVAGESGTGQTEPVIGILVVINGGVMTNNGTVTVSGASCTSLREAPNEGGPNGGLLCLDSGTFKNYGTVTLADGGEHWGGYLDIINNSTFCNYQNATVTFSGSYLRLWTDEADAEAAFDNSGTLNITKGWVEVEASSSLDSSGTITIASGAELNIYEGAAVSISEEGSLTNNGTIGVGPAEDNLALLFVCDSFINNGSINIYPTGNSVLVLLPTGSMTNNGTITNAGRINVMGAIDTSNGTISNSGHFFVQYSEDVSDITGKDNITNSENYLFQFLAFEEGDIGAAMSRGYTDIVICDEIALTSDLTIPEDTKLTVDDGCSLVVPEGQTLTNNGEIYLALCWAAENDEEQTEAMLLIAGTLTNAGMIQIADIYDGDDYSGGSSVLWIDEDAALTNIGTIINYGRITNVGTLDTSTDSAAITNNGHFFTLSAIVGRDRITNSTESLFVFIATTADALTAAINDGYPDIIIDADITNDNNFTVTADMTIMISEDCTFTNNGTITNEGIIINEGTIINGGTIAGSGTISGNEPTIPEP